MALLTSFRPFIDYKRMKNMSKDMKCVLFHWNYDANRINNLRNLQNKHFKVSVLMNFTHIRQKKKWLWYSNDCHTCFGNVCYFVVNLKVSEHRWGLDCYCDKRALKPDCVIHWIVFVYAHIKMVMMPSSLTVLHT